jgi:hypothetical protein
MAYAHSFKEAAMVMVVVTINLLIALLCLYATLQLCHLRQTLAAVAKTLAAAERNTHSTLQNAPEAIIQGQLGIYQLRQAYQQSGPQFQRIRRALALLGLGQSFLRRSQGNVLKPLLLRQGNRSMGRRRF